jgi:mannose-6-phosphate isomerase-like protein (cupin superfamily)
MRIAMLSPISWRTPPRHYGPWENIVSLLTEELLRLNVDVTLFATADSKTNGKLVSACPLPYSEDTTLDPKVYECLHISQLFEMADQFDLIHNQFDFLPLTYSGLIKIPLVTTIHGFSSPAILPVYKKYNGKVHYIAISEADKSPELNYLATIYHGIDIAQFSFNANQGKYLLFFGRIHPHKGVIEAIEVAKMAGIKLLIAGIVQDEEYFKTKVEPLVDGERVEYIGSVGPDKRDKVLGGAVALLHLISFEEPFGLSLVESMACGTPVIAFGRGSIPEIIKDGSTGFIVDGIEGAVKAVGNISLIDRNVCRTHVEEKFTAKRMANDYLEAYTNILDARENYRPWGHYENLDEMKEHKVKKLIVEPGKRLSLQKHNRRAEHWFVTGGKGIVTVGEKEIPLIAGQSVDIPKGVQHRIMNTGDVSFVLIEVQAGDYFGEDDIIRIEDDFGRV